MKKNKLVRLSCMAFILFFLFNQKTFSQNQIINAMKYEELKEKYTDDSSIYITYRCMTRLKNMLQDKYRYWDLCAKYGESSMKGLLNFIQIHWNVKRDASIELIRLDLLKNRAGYINSNDLDLMPHRISNWDTDQFKGIAVFCDEHLIYQDLERKDQIKVRRDPQSYYYGR